MPELPEVETLKVSLEKELLQKTIVNVDIRRPKLRYLLDHDLKSKIIGARILGLYRRAKYLLLELDNSHTVVIHLGMTGRATGQAENYHLQKHDHVALYLSGARKLVFNDARRFGMIYCLPSDNLMQHKIFASSGPEPLEEDFSAEYLLKKLKNKKVPIKTALMQNEIVVGVGNIYASESLFLAKINPLKLANSLSVDETNRLVEAVKKVLWQAIKAGGTTLKDFVDGDNKPGYFKQKLLVYDREGKACIACDSGSIAKLRQAGRSTFYCDICQK